MYGGLKLSNVLNVYSLRLVWHESKTKQTKTCLKRQKKIMKESKTIQIKPPKLSRKSS